MVPLYLFILVFLIWLGDWLDDRWPCRPHG